MDSPDRLHDEVRPDVAVLVETSAAEVQPLRQASMAEGG
jgi:hypothetical protein